MAARSKTTTKREHPMVHTPHRCEGCGIDIFDPANRSEAGRVQHEKGCKVDAAAEDRRADLRDRLARADASAEEMKQERTEKRAAAAGRTPREERPPVEVHDYVRGDAQRCATCGGARNIKAHTHVANREA